MLLATQEHLTQETGAAATTSTHTEASLKTPEELTRIVTRYAASTGWMHRVRLSTEQRWYERLHHGPDHDIWAISWLPGQSTGFHDHGASAGAFVVATGTLEEHRPGEPLILVPPGQPRSFARGYAHDVRNASLAPAISIHAYSPPLDEMNEYDLDGSQLIPREHASDRAATLDLERRAKTRQPAGWDSAPTIEQVLTAARARLRRLSPQEASEAVTYAESILVDIRPEAQRAREGTIPGALIVERNVLEWRFDPASEARLSIATDHDLQVIVFCSEGYTSSLAAVALQEIGLWRATDIIGGFQAWQAAGLPLLPLARPGVEQPKA